MLSDGGGYSHLDDNKQADASAHFRGVSIHASHHVNDGLANGDEHTKHWRRQE